MKASQDGPPPRSVPRLRAEKKAQVQQVGAAGCPRDESTGPWFRYGRAVYVGVVNAPALEFQILTVAGWLGRRQAAMVEYLVAENRVLPMAEENPRWGYTRIKGALSYLGYEIGRTTVKRILVENGFDPAPERGRRTSWSTFLEARLGAIAAMDFFAAEAVTLTGLVRYFVLIVIDLETRRVEIAGIVHQPDGHWTAQIARNLTDVASGFLRDERYVIHDRDPLLTAKVRTILEPAGVTPIRLPAKSPNLKGYASHCTSLVGSGTSSEKRRRLDSLRPWVFTGGSSPGCSYRHAFLSLYA